MLYRRTSLINSTAFILLLFVLGMGCGEIPRDEKKPSDKKITLKQSVDLLQFAQVSCRDENCPEALAYLVSADDGGVKQCTSFLVGPRLLATNSHCIPNDIRNGASCEGRIRALFPAGPGHGKAEAHCASLKFASDYRFLENPISLDYAFIELDRELDRKPLEISREGVPSGMALRVPVMQINADKLRAQISEIQCRSLWGTYHSPLYRDSHSPIISIVDCPIRLGNSGAPLLDSDGKVRAILQGRFDFQDETSHMLEDGTVAPAGLASNFGCIALPEESYSFPEACAAPQNYAEASVQRKAALKRAGDAFKNEFLALRDQWAAEQAPELQWSYESRRRREDRLLMFRPKPECRRQAGAIRSKRILFPVWATRGIIYTRRLELSYKFELSEQEAAVLSVDADGKTLIQAGRNTLFQGQLPLCR